MAEQEIIKHTKKAYTIWNSKDHTFWHKLKEFLVEIFIIVFAVTISIWLHNWSEHRSEQAQVTDFFTDLTNDLQKDIASITAERTDLDSAVAGFNYLQNISAEEIERMNRIDSTIELNTNQIIRNNFGANYEGFKSSGKIGLIEDKQLKKLILEYNEETLPRLASEEIVYNQQMEKTTNYAMNNIGKPDKEILLNPKFKVLLRVDLQWAARINRDSNAALQKAKQIMTAINK